MDRLQYPEGYPPKGLWDRFFLGVRWLGPDLSFFKLLKKMQGERSGSAMATWGSTSCLQIAQFVGEQLSAGLGWRSNVFLPEDSFAVAFHGPSFSLFDDLAAEEIALNLINKYKLPQDFFHDFSPQTIGELVDAVVQQRAD